MQRELSLRLEEIDSSQGEEVSKVKQRYIHMFQGRVPKKRPKK